MGFVYFLFVCFVGLLLISAAFKVGKSFRLGRDIYRSFECGFQSLSNARIPFSLKFYLLAIIFLLFDVELALILPFFFRLRSSVRIFIFLFFSVLLFGLVHECNEGSLEWR